ncbi:hypothetical protein JNK13_01580 [bacterium]|nr:hypothetical protein [bacterium]
MKLQEAYKKTRINAWFSFVALVICACVWYKIAPNFPIQNDSGVHGFFMISCGIFFASWILNAMKAGEHREQLEIWKNTNNRRFGR